MYNTYLNKKGGTWEVAAKKKKTSKSKLPEEAVTKTSPKKGGKPASMADLLEKFGTGIKGHRLGEKVKGKILRITSNRVVLDIGGKSEGVVAEKAFNEARDFVKSLKVGDELIVKVLVTETPEGFTIVSLRDAAQDATWKKLEDAKKEGKPVPVIGKSVNPSGLNVEVDSLTGFIPNSQLGKVVSKNPSGLIEKHFKATVLELKRDENKVVLSEREVSDAEDIKKVKTALGKIKEGEVYEGVVTTLASFGCFVAIEAPVGKEKVSVEGLVHISELSWGKVDATSDFVSEGDKVKVKVIGIKEGKLALSMKQAQKDPWEDASKKYKKDSKHKSKVVRITDFGVFVELEKGVEGLIHMTKIPPGIKLEDDQEVNIYVEEIDSKARKLSLGMVLTAKPVGYK